ncbi:ABC transporter ATP-binding protein|uniref:ATP-binding cassette, subfamily B n=1 Tax=Dendrosporobacter quercicolus TaxID=146817 RepID=A0A1G9NJE7_9FIRM|nr:ABC transporter ATP-binding protein [Dendrosporobacter quercicolus]NSL47362.1 ABC transporter ATP-binding protein [Dendrosporobacter quercicolus DSM 1736]SDL86708.1 ATP-binding cassette, subfamily B [Dendrosporobacter quercicolus]
MVDGRVASVVRPGDPRGNPLGRFNKRPDKLKNARGTIQRLLAYLGGKKKLLILTFLLCFITTIISIIGTWLNGYAVDHFIEKGDMPGLLQLCIMLAAIYCVSVASTYWQNRCMVDIAQRTAAKIRRDLYRDIQILPLQYFDTHSSGDLMSRLTNDVDNINMTLGQSITQLFSGAVSIVGMLAAMLLLSPVLTLVGLTTVPLTFLLSKLIMNKTQPFFIKQQQELGNLNGYIEERISGQKLIILCGREEQAKAEFAKINKKLTRSAIFAQALSGIMGPVNNAVNNLTYFMLTVSGAYLIFSGSNITVGVIFTFILYMRNFTRPLNETLNIFNTIQSALAGAERVFEVMDEPKEKDAEQAKEVCRFKGEITLQQVNFSYTKEQGILKNVSLKAHKGQTIAIVGPTGSGKTTLIHLLTRFYDIDSGEILIDGENIDTIKRSCLRRAIAMVLQDTYLFSESVRENIRYGRLTATDEEVEQAARLANAHRFIKQLPEGYDTVLTDNGGNLSQGQRQLLALARAVLAQASVLILDEATSSVDTRTEAAIQKAMLSLMQGKTAFVIAHRLSTIRNADEILAVKDGQIIERGTHQELMAQGNFYAGLYNSQFKGLQI